MLTYAKVLGVTFGTSAEAARAWDHAVIRQYGGNFSFDCLNFEDSFDDVLHLLSQGQVLAYADVCWRMLAYADVCLRMLTYADVTRWTTCCTSCRKARCFSYSDGT